MTRTIIIAATTLPYTALMPARHFQRRSVRTIWALLTAFAILYALGLRVCIHGAGFAGGAAPSIYLESTLATNEGDGCSAKQHVSDERDACWVDVSLSGILNDISTTSLLLPFLVILVVLSPPRLLLRIVRPPQPLFPTGRGHSLRPPLRAPPR